MLEIDETDEVLRHEADELIEKILIHLMLQQIEHLDEHDDKHDDEIDLDEVIDDEVDELEQDEMLII